ncbi:MAG: PfkB family carbohydrate kinase [Bacteroidota bacterium]
MARKESTNMSLNTLFKNKTVLIVGDVMIDAYIHGKVDRISPEAPVPVLLESFTEYRLGGAANVALNVKKLGAFPLLVSIIGKDKTSEILENILQKEDISLQGLRKSQNLITTIKTRVMSNNQQIIRIDREKAEDLPKKEEDVLIDVFSNYLNKFKIDVAIIEDYNKGTLTQKTISRLIEIANKNKVDVVVDPKKKNFDLYKNVTLFKPNLKEFTEGTNLKIDNSEIKHQLDKVAFDFLNKSQNKMLMVTLSEKGIYIANKKKSFHFPAHVRNIFDVSGAGDTVISVAALCIASKLNEEQIAQISNLSGGLVCEQSGVVPVSITQLNAEVLKNNLL